MREPLQSGVTASPFRRVYGMHRYFARRPHNLFESLISHYSDEGDVILDPFFGGGVTVVEGLNLGRRVVGYDLNPLARFVTKMEVAPFDEQAVNAAVAELRQTIADEIARLFGTRCPACDDETAMDWAEVSSIADCSLCGQSFLLGSATKVGVGTWSCPGCSSAVRFSVTASTPEAIDAIRVSCRCGFEGVKDPTPADVERWIAMPSEVAAAASQGPWFPKDEIPDCNMQRESALHKKGITQFAQLFSPRVLLGWAYLRQAIEQRREDAATPWLWFAFSSALRYANRMVTRNPGWRGDKPLEWAKPGYWFPPVHLEVNVWTQFERRIKSISNAKRSFQIEGALREGSPAQVVRGNSDYSLRASSSTKLDLPDDSVDGVVTDPPYGSYVHYADLTNFWIIWLPPDVGPGMGKLADTREEAVIARKRGFPGAKNAADYRRLLEMCFGECFRVLKPGGYMVLTFNNREPRAWLALVSAVSAAGFDLPPKGVIFQEGIKHYAHTAQSRRNGSVIGDFVYSFRKPREAGSIRPMTSLPSAAEFERRLVKVGERVLQDGPLSPRDFFTRMYLEVQPYLWSLVQAAGTERLDELGDVVDKIVLFDSHRRSELERHFAFEDGQWARRAA